MPDPPRGHLLDAASHPRGRRVAASLTLVLLSALLSPLASWDPATAAVRPTGPLAPARGTLFGASVKPLSGSTTQSAFKGAVTGLETDLGRRLAIDHHTYAWGATLPSWREPWDVANGRTPMMTWGQVDVAKVNAGGQDAYIRARADAVKGLGKQVFIRWFPNMDAAPATVSRSPSAFISAWRRIHGIFKNRGATNAVFAWCPSAAGFKSGKAQTYYPGDAYVHWICAGGYNLAPGKTGATWTSLVDLFRPFYTWASAKPKPLMIGETGVQERLVGDKAKWVNDARAVLKGSFPNVMAFVYQHARTDYDWRMNTTPGSYDSFKALAQDQHFRAGTTAGTLFGAYVKPSVWTDQGYKDGVTQFESSIGRRLDIDQHYYPWAEPFPTFREPWDIQSGRIPLITWAGTDVARINSGSQDTMIRARADAVKALGSTVFIRWFSEADAMAHELETRSPSAYITAWRRIHGIFKNRGATNVRWVWCGTANGFSTGRAQRFYPGDAYVHWTCADGFNWAPGRTGASWNSFANIFKQFYAWAAPKPKPIMIAETGVQERNLGEKAKWLTDARNAIKTTMPKIRAFVYFNAYARDFSGTFYDWRVQTTALSLDSFRQMGLDFFFRPWHHALLTL